MTNGFRIKKASEDVVREGAELMRKGEVIVFGSPGVYVICCDPFNKKSVDKVFELKQRDISKACQIGVAPEDVDKYGKGDANGKGDAGKKIS